MVLTCESSSSDEKDYAKAIINNDKRQGYLTDGEDGLMVRKELCPQCGSKKIVVEADSKKCEVCGYQWTGKVRKKTSRKGRTRF